MAGCYPSDRLPNSGFKKGEEIDEGEGRIDMILWIEERRRLKKNEEGDGLVHPIRIDLGSLD